MSFFVISLKHVSGLKVALNCPGTLKLWAITHENAQKTRKRHVSVHSSKTCNESYEPCKSSWNPKSVGNNSLKRSKNTKTMSFFIITLKHVSGLKIAVNRYGNPELWAIAAEDSNKTRKRCVLATYLKHVTSHTSHANPPRTQKLWAITHENG